MEGNMNKSPKSTRDAEPAARKTVSAQSGIPLDIATLVCNGMERIAQLQKDALDVAVQQNNEMIGICQQVFRLTPDMPGMAMFETTAQAFDSYVETQKYLIDMIVEQGVTLLDFTSSRGESASRVLENATGMFQQSMDRGIATHKSVLDFAAGQTRAAGEAAKRQFAGTPAEAAADSITRGMDTLFATHKELLDIASRPLRTFAKAS
jgi:hypothetical protein